MSLFRNFITGKITKNLIIKKEMFKENFRFFVVGKNGYFREIFAKEDIEKFRTICTENAKFFNFL